MAQTKLSFDQINGRPWVTIEDYGGGSDKTAAQNTTALHAARDYLDGLGGGTIFCGSKSYPITEFTFGTSSNVTIEGLTPAVSSGGNGIPTARLYCTTGVWAIRMPQTCYSPALRNISIQSNGVVAAPNVTAGVEYGVLIEQRSVEMENVIINGFQHNWVIGGYGFSSIYRNISSLGGTYSNFAITAPDNTSRGYQHPNLAVESPALDNTTIVVLDNCTLRAGAWGSIIRGGEVVFNNCTIEANLYGAILGWQGTNDPGCRISSTGKLWVEQNWGAFSPTAHSTDWNSVAVTGNNFLLDTAGVPITLVDNATNNLSDFGYQITFGAYTTGTVKGPGRSTFRDISMTCTNGGATKAFLAKQCWRTTIDEVSVTGGTATADYFRAGGAGGYNAYLTHVYRPYNGTWPATFGSRGFIVDFEGSASTGGLTASCGDFRSESDADNVEGTYTSMATGFENTHTGTHSGATSSTVMNSGGTPFTDSALIGKTIYNLTTGASGTVTANSTSTVTVASLSGGSRATWVAADEFYVGSITGTVYYVRFRNTVTIDFPFITGTSGYTYKTYLNMPTAIRPARAKKVPAVVITDNTTTQQQGIADIGTDGVMTFYIDAANNAWTNSGTCEIRQFSVTYTLL